ncbi:MAG: hypothetical protein M1836_005549 [Candelina mexicana]|nr:MAG: hypothetical protein M1836_005549 [Candelina mexicana]
MTNYDKLITDNSKDQLKKILTDDELENLLKKIKKKKMKLNESESDDKEEKSEFEEFNNKQKK